jgi:hypothetical protein
MTGQVLLGGLVLQADVMHSCGWPQSNNENGWRSRSNPGIRLVMFVAVPNAQTVPDSNR